jgi:sugar/nucleoside kinase (ribokinase family)
VNTGGAGDALFAAFVHGYVAGHDPHTALRHAVVFAGHKVGARRSSQGFLDCEQLAHTAAQNYGVER